MQTLPPVSNEVFVGQDYSYNLWVKDILERRRVNSVRLSYQTNFSFSFKNLEHFSLEN